MCFCGTRMTHIDILHLYHTGCPKNEFLIEILEFGHQWAPPETFGDFGSFLDILNTNHWALLGTLGSQKRKYTLHLP